MWPSSVVSFLRIVVLAALGGCERPPRVAQVNLVQRRAGDRRGRHLHTDGPKRAQDRGQGRSPVLDPRVERAVLETELADQTEPVQRFLNAPVRLGLPQLDVN